MLSPWPYHFSPASQAQAPRPTLENFACAPHAGHWRRLEPGDRKTATGQRNTSANLAAKLARNYRNFHPFALNIFNKTNNLSSLKNICENSREKIPFHRTRVTSEDILCYPNRCLKELSTKPTLIFPEGVALAIHRAFPPR